MIPIWDKMSKEDRIYAGIAIVGIFLPAVHAIGLSFILDNIYLIVAGLSTAGTALYLYNKKQKADKDAWLLRNEKAHLIELVDIIVSAIDLGENLDNSSKNLDIKKLEKLLSRIKVASFLYSSSEILEYSLRLAIRLEKETLAGEIDPEEALKLFERMLRMIRRELGHDDSRLPPGSLLQTIMIKEGMKEEDKLAIRKALFEICKDENYRDIYGPKYSKPKALDLS